MVAVALGCNYRPFPFTGPWRFKTNSASCRALFPIPENQISVNPNLEQNPEYPGCGDGVPQ